MRLSHLVLLALAWLIAGSVPAQELVVFAYPGMPKTDAATLQRLYTGRIVSIRQQSAQPVALVAGHPVRRDFLARLFGQDEGEYIAYWLVRRYVGKGAPPQEFADVDELIGFVTRTPGAVGYALADRLPAGSNIIFRLQPDGRRDSPDTPK